MLKPRSPIADYLVCLAVRLTMCIVQMLSWSASLRLARWLAWLAYQVNRRHRLVAADNVRHAFPALDEAQVDRLVRASYEHLFMMAAEMIRLPRTLTRLNLDRYVRCHPEHEERLNASLALKRPRLVVTGHFGNWEVMSYMTGLLGIRGPVVARRLDNPHLDALMRTFRQKTGLEMLDKQDDYEKILAALARGPGLGMVIDQDAGPKGLFVEFFGRPASTFKSVALLSLEYAAPILVCGAARVGHPLQYRYYLEDVIFPEEYARRPDAVRAITQRYTSALEGMARRHPEQYFWLHRRWKHQPRARKAA